ncbi:MAG: Stk1 family PASTA domain-containing Ser/Thr kinase [Bacillota bacterium]|nr:Stk1 family PASTA domain-containing Ser/Thr kinase [Bacillota bacterium]
MNRGVEMEGMILGNRYELLEKIGGGGMALVYKAKCNLLNRFVAVKILRSDFTNDEEFVKRFRIEAQAAASLSHPNIVSIYDVGHEGNIHYIVMEYVDGITLKDYISRKGALNWREAIEISIQICSAIEHAHRNHIVHRDIKPHNILLTNEGIIKVTDFGIARAVSASTITMVGSTIGSVHYFSPEQARGGFVDEKSDIYSLGITLYEMVTGRLPFDGESPVAVALKHIQDEPEVPMMINKDIPSGVNDIIMKAIKKELGKRYQSATDMLRDFYKVLKEPGGNFVTVENDSGSPTKRIQAIGNNTPIKRDEFLIKENKPDNTKGNKKKDKLTYILAGITSVIIIALAIFIGYNAVMPSIKPEQHKDFVMENYKNKDINDVKDELSKAGIDVDNIKVTRQNSNDVDKDMIISQTPAQGSTLKPGGYNNIEFVVSDGPKVEKMPDLTKRDAREAATRAEQDYGLKVTMEDEFNDTVAEGLVTRTDPEAGDDVKSGDSVTIYRSKGPQITQTKVPKLIGLTESQAKKALADANLTLGKEFPEGSSNTGKIIDQKPAAGTSIEENKPVDIYFQNNLQGRVNVTRMISLNNPQSLPDTVHIVVQAVPSDTNAMEVLMDKQVNQKDFPVQVVIPVPNGGTTDVKVFINEKQTDEFVQNITQ